MTIFSSIFSQNLISLCQNISLHTVRYLSLDVVIVRLLAFLNCCQLLFSVAFIIYHICCQLFFSSFYEVNFDDLLSAASLVLAKPQSFLYNLSLSYGLKLLWYENLPSMGVVNLFRFQIVWKRIPPAPPPPSCYPLKNGDLGPSPLPQIRHPALQNEGILRWGH